MKSHRFWTLSASCLLLSLGLWFAPLSTNGQQAKPFPKPAPAQAGKKDTKHGRGRKVDPRKVAEQRRISVLLHGRKLKALPRAAEATWDCRTLGQVPPIRDQGQCGSCWDFSGTGVCSCQMIVAGFGKPDGSFNLSEQYTLDCGQNGGCNGDDNTTVLDWCKKTGLPTDTDYGVPYSASAGSCASKSGMKLYQLKDWGFCTTTDQQGVAKTQDIKNAMKAYGPIGCAVDASFNDPGTGVISGGGSNIDHDVILVGWDDSKGNGGAWIMRNSWGTSWGNQGYAWIEYGSYSIGTEAVWATAGQAPLPPPQAPTVTSSLVVSATANAAFTYQITATNSPTAYNATGLPSGVGVDQTTGIISGMPTTVGSYTVTISAANAAGVGQAALALIVTGPGPGPTNVVLNLTPDQVQSVIQQSGMVVIYPEMSLNDALKALEKCREQAKSKAKTSTTKEPPLKTSSQSLLMERSRIQEAISAWAKKGK